VPVRHLPVSWIALYKFPSDEDLSALDRYLSHCNIPHRFTDEMAMQVLWVPDAEHAQKAAQVMAAFAKAPHMPPAVAPEKTPLNLPAAGDAMITYALVLLSVCGYLLNFAPHSWVVKVTFMPVPLPGQAWPAVWHYWLSTGEFWRILTPTFLHWSLLHLVFNALCVLEFGKRLEAQLGRLGYVGLFLFTALWGNLAQFTHQPNHGFGGISSVVYGFLGFMAWTQWRLPSTSLRLPQGMILFMLVCLGLGFSGWLDSFIGPMANAGHLGGLVSGVVAAVAAGFICPDRLRR
jgi:GlpG protein